MPNVAIGSKISAGWDQLDPRSLRMVRDYSFPGGIVGRLYLAQRDAVARAKLIAETKAALTAPLTLSRPSLALEKAG